MRDDSNRDGSRATLSPLQIETTGPHTLALSSTTGRTSASTSGLFSKARCLAGLRDLALFNAVELDSTFGRPHLEAEHVATEGGRPRRDLYYQAAG